VTDDLSKWKSRCASLTAEVVALRAVILSFTSEYGLNYIECGLYDEANYIKAEREASIPEDERVTIEVKPA
jgi:hypothetical protein